jgi:hypothetical protein
MVGFDIFKDLRFFGMLPLDRRFARPCSRFEIQLKI